MMRSPPHQDRQTDFSGPVRRKSDIAARIKAEEVKLLFDLGTASRYSMVIIVVVMGLIFFSTSPFWATGLILTIQIIAQFYFDHLRTKFHADRDVIANAPDWARRYTIGTFLSGLTWGVGAIVWVPASDVIHHIFFALVLAALCMSTAVMRANHLPAVATYFITATTPMLILVSFERNLLFPGGLVLAVIFLFILFRIAQRLNSAYQVAIRLRFEKTDLVERMARAHAATEQKRADAEEAERLAQAANRAKNDFLDILGHRVSIPLEQLGEMARELREEAFDENQKRLADAMLTSATSLRTLFDDMVDFSQIEAGACHLNMQRFSPVELMNDVVREMRPKAMAQGLSLELDIVLGASLPIMGDPRRLRQVLVNLISNAIKFTETGGVILRMQAVTLDDGNKELRLSVIDTGIGITNDARSRLFSSFAQGAYHTSDNSNPSDTSSVGLGLAIADRLVRLMGGQIEVDSAVGQGGTFWFLLPYEISQRASGAQITGQIEANEPLTRDAQHRAGALIDHDYLYEMEQALGIREITDKIIDTLTQTLSLLKEIESAQTNDDKESLREKAIRLQEIADETGLLAIAEAAASLAKAAPVLWNEEISDLQRRVSTTWGQLARAYPDISSEVS